jgi:tripartite-type tricarboxylate transporter receptor subunit TctC
MMRATALWLALALCVAGGMTGSRAEGYPSRAIRVIVGPSPDTTSRVYAERIQRNLGQPVVVEPRTGAGGDIAARSVASAEPDGYTLLYATSAMTLNAAMRTAHYDIVADFAPIAQTNVSSYVLVIPPGLPANNLQELIALAKQRPGELNCASAGNGTPPHLACELFNAMAGVKTVHVPYRDSNTAMNALLGGHVQMLFAVSVNARALIEGKQVRPLAIASPRQSRLYPGIPTLSEAGLPGFEVNGWGSYMAPAATPKPVIDILNAEMVRALDDPQVQQTLDRLGQDRPPPMTPAAMAEFVKNDIARWNRIIDIAGIVRAK